MPVGTGGRADSGDVLTNAPLLRLQVDAASWQSTAPLPPSSGRRISCLLADWGRHGLGAGNEACAPGVMDHHAGATKNARWRGGLYCEHKKAACYNIRSVGAWRSPVAHRYGVPVVGGS